MLHSNLPLLSVITITYENDEGLQYTLESLPDDVVDVEHIVIEGAAAKSTVRLLEEYNNRRSWLRWVSERDDGIYDAMNKGLIHSHGDYIIFMNAGDGFYNLDTITRIAKVLKERKPDILYGETMYINDEEKEVGLRSEIARKVLPANLSVEVMKEGMMVCHQSFIAKREIVPYYVLTNFSADYQWMIQVIKVAKIIVNYEGIIANYLVGGASKKRHFTSLKDRLLIMNEEFGWVETLKSHLMMVRKFFGFRPS